MYRHKIKTYPSTYSFLKEIVGPQISSICSNKDMAKPVISYINNNQDKSKISDNCFNLLLKLFNQNVIESELNEEFIKSLFKELSIVKEKSLLNKIITILIEINYKYAAPEGNIILKVHKEHENLIILN